jgi:hypothetical protein
MSDVRLDHLVYAVPNLARAIETFERSLGTAPVAGGRHAGMGTHNAILPLGDLSYVELIAADPDAEDPGRPRPFGLDALEGPRLVTWAVRSNDIEATVLRAKERGYDPGVVFEMSRARPEGDTLRWKLSLRAEPVGDGLVPFVIDWGDSEHPARAEGGTAPCTLESFRAHHPSAGPIRQALDALGARLEVLENAPGTRPQLEATLIGPAGRLELR